LSRGVKAATRTVQRANCKMKIAKLWTRILSRDDGFRDDLG